MKSRRLAPGGHVFHEEVPMLRVPHRPVVLAALTLFALQAPSGVLRAEEGKAPRPAAPTVPALEKLKALAGDWIDADGKQPPDKIGVVYRVTGGGSAVIETLAPGTPHEMVSVYHRDGTDLVMTHYCAVGNQPRLRGKPMAGNVLVMDYEGGTNVDPTKDVHIHGVRFDFVAADEIRVDWIGWKGGKPEAAPLKLHLKRKPAA
jgi:hypothetical protein